MTARWIWDRKRLQACMKGIGVIRHIALDTYRVSRTESYPSPEQPQLLRPPCEDEDEEGDSTSSRLLAKESMLEEDEEEEEDDEGQLCADVLCSAWCIWCSVCMAEQI